MKVFEEFCPLPPRYDCSPILLMQDGPVLPSLLFSFSFLFLFFFFFFFDVRNSTVIHGVITSLSFVYLLLLLSLWITACNTTRLSDGKLAQRPPARMGTSM